MYENVGAKIKGVAVIVTAIGFIISVVLFLILISTGTLPMYALGVAVLIGGMFISWLSSLALYGFGELIENSDIIAGRLNLKDLDESDYDDNQEHTSMNEK